MRLPFHCQTCGENWMYGWDWYNLSKFFLNIRNVKVIRCSKCKTKMSLNLFMNQLNYYIKQIT